MGGWIHDDHVFVDRELMAVGFDLLGDVVALRCEGQWRERPTDGVDGREMVVVLEGRHHFLVARDGDDAEVWLPSHRALLPQVVPVFVGVLTHAFIGEEVHRREIGHCSLHEYDPQKLIDRSN